MMAEVMGVGKVPGGVKTGCPYVCKYSLMMAYNVCIFPCLIPYFFLPELKNCSRSKLEIVFLGVFPPCWLSGVHMFELNYRPVDYYLVIWRTLQVFAQHLSSFKLKLMFQAPYVP